jgi:hypothetical protein
MSKDVHKAYETYFRRDDGGLLETGKHFLLLEPPMVGSLLVSHREKTPLRVVSVELDGKIVVELCP